MKKKKIAMLIAFRDFRDEEYFIPKKILEAAGAEIITVSDSLGKAIGKMGGEAEIDILLENFKPEECDVVLFIGGAGAHKYMGNEICQRIAKETLKNNKILGAICVAPAILAKAGVLKNKKAVVWSSAMDKSAVKILKQAGAFYQNKPVVVDGRIITASGPAAAEDFAKAVIKAYER